MPKWTAPESTTYHLQADRSPHSHERCTPECRTRGGRWPWIAKGTEIDPVQYLNELLAPPPETFRPY